MGARMARKPKSDRIFDDASPYVDRFGLLLIVTIASVAMLSLIDVDRSTDEASAALGPMVTTVFVGVTLLLALRASGVSHRWWRLATLLISILVVSYIVLAVTIAAGAIPASRAVVAAPPTTLIVLAVLAPVIVVRRLLHHREISRGTLQGAISAYLLIPVAFFYAFEAVNAYAGTPFFGDPQPSTSFMYFSLSTITTVGYGDLTAAGDLGRLLATSEAIIGQIYLVTFVAMIVALFAQRRSGPKADESPAA